MIQLVKKRGIEMGITIENVAKKFPKVEAIKDLSLKVNSHEIMGLIGPSGSGKTTLIRIVTGALHADRGEVRIDDTKVPDMALFPRLGFMPQSDALYPDLTGYDNLLFFGRLFGLKGERLKARVEEMLGFIGLTEDGNRLVSRYSGGMKKRLSLIIALLHDPEYLLLDEPTVGIDPVLRKKIWDHFRALAEQGKTLVISTHVMDEAEHCDRVALLYRGGILAAGTIPELKAKTSSGQIEELFFALGGEAA